MPKGKTGKEGWMYNDYTMILAWGDIVFHEVDCPCREMGIGTIWRWENEIKVKADASFQDNAVTKDYTASVDSGR